MPQRFRLPDSTEGIAHYRLDELEHAESNFAVCPYPIPQILAELRMKYGGTASVPWTAAVTFWRQARPPAAALPRSWVGPNAQAPGSAP
jgi:hypothetical protein